VVVVSAAVRTVSRVAMGFTMCSALAVLLLGCSDDEPRAEEQSPSVSDPTTGTTSESTSEPTASIEPTEPTEPTVTPAAGLLLKGKVSQLNAPEGEWERIPDIVKFATAVGLRTTGEVISLSDWDNFATVLSLDEQAKAHNRTLPEGAIIRRQDDVMLDGAPAYYVQWWEKGDTKIQHDIGVDYRDRVINIQMDLSRTDPAASEALVASVLASFRWR
jgi:hypothetical protein